MNPGLAGREIQKSPGGAKARDRCPFRDRMFFSKHVYPGAATPRLHNNVSSRREMRKSPGGTQACSRAALAPGTITTSKKTMHPNGVRTTGD